MAALKETILFMLNGENCSALTMDVIRSEQRYLFLDLKRSALQVLHAL